MKNVALTAALFALLLGTLPVVAVGPALAEAPQLSLSKDQRRFVTIVHRLEGAPLDPALKRDRSWAVQWLTDTEDVSVSICADPLNGVVASSFAYSGEVLVQYMLGMGAYILENPDKKSDLNAQQLAGVESALKAYDAMRRADPLERSKAMDDLVDKQKRGELSEFVSVAFAKCLKKDAD